MPETLELSLDGLKDWLNKNTNSIVDPLRHEAKKVLEDVESKLEELSEGCDKLLDDAEKEMAKGSRKTYKRAKFLYKLAGTFQSAIDEITVPKEINGKTLNETLDQLKKAMNLIGQEKTKWFRAISPYFIMSRRRFDFAFKRADDSYRAFQSFMLNDYVKAESAENVFSDVDSLNRSLEELNKHKRDKEKRKQKQELLETKIIESQKKLSEIQNKGQVVELAQLNSKIDELTEEIKHELRHIKKPLLKFQTLVNSPGHSLFPDEASKLDEYLSNPFDALATEKEGYPLLKAIAKKIGAALDNKKMKLKPSRLRKAKDQIKRLVEKDVLGSLQNSTKEAFSKREELSKSGIISETRNERSELQEKLKKLKRQKGILKTHDTLFEKDYGDARSRVEELKTSLERTVSELSGTTVKILVN